MDWVWLEGKGFSTRKHRRRAEKEEPTSNCPDPLSHDYSRDRLTDYKEQSEADSNSPIFIPNRICSDHENSCHRDLMAWLVAPSVVRTIRKCQRQKREP